MWRRVHGGSCCCCNKNWLKTTNSHTQHVIISGGCLNVAIMPVAHGQTVYVLFSDFFNATAKAAQKVKHTTLRCAADSNSLWAVQKAKNERGKGKRKRRRRNVHTLSSLGTVICCSQWWLYESSLFIFPTIWPLIVIRKTFTYVHINYIYK